MVHTPQGASASKAPAPALQGALFDSPPCADRAPRFKPPAVRSIAARLRAQAKLLRMKPTPLADLIPLLQEAADALDATTLPPPEAPVRKGQVGRFNGPAFDPERDAARLTGQLLRIWELVKDGEWFTLAEIAVKTGSPPASVSAQLRHLRKPRFGAHTVEREHLGHGLYRYRVIANAQAET